ncbi:hypothetical protein E2C01_022750 [Portunus trituberculatus]|uniref:Uncharacterized protein n=1 Tax=Portunus trituberculatus TaxID=210409 RepID=A0A5B7E678_PORTR|nr:hypothetical protein [Portunus trituberculatus]
MEAGEDRPIDRHFTRSIVVGLELFTISSLKLARCGMKGTVVGWRRGRPGEGGKGGKDRKGGVVAGQEGNAEVKYMNGSPATLHSTAYHGDIRRNTHHRYSLVPFVSYHRVLGDAHQPGRMPIRSKVCCRKESALHLDYHHREETGVTFLQSPEWLHRVAPSSCRTLVHWSRQAARASASPRPYIQVGTVSGTVERAACVRVRHCRHEH